MPDRSILHKILFVGPMGAGKTTAIACISDSPPITTEAMNSDSTISTKATTTVAMDYGTIELKNDIVHLYGIPGQHRFNFMWPILAKGALGCIVLIDDSQPHAMEELDIYLKEFDDLISKQAFVVGIGRTNKDGTAIAKYTDYFMKRGLYAPIFEVDVRKKADVLMMLEVILVNTEIKNED